MRKVSDNLYYSIEAMHAYNIDAQNGEIYLMGEEGLGDDAGEEPGVEYTMASRFIRNLNFMDRHFNGKSILVHMKTCGGSWEEGMAIYDAIKNCSSRVVVLSYTHARSMSSIILQAADQRVLMPHSTFMFHDGIFGTTGTWKQVKTEVEFYKRTEQQMLDIYIDSLKHGGKFKSWSRGRIQTMLLEEMAKTEEVYLSAQDAVDWGFADEIFDGNWDKLKI